MQSSIGWIEEPGVPVKALAGTTPHNEGKRTGVVVCVLGASHGHGLVYVRWQEPHGTCDYWLTRNYHGAGYWDRGLGEIGERLTKFAHHRGEVDLYLGDDGKGYIS